MAYGNQENNRHKGHGHDETVKVSGHFRAHPDNQVILARAFVRFIIREFIDPKHPSDKKCLGYPYYKRINSHVSGDGIIGAQAYKRTECKKDKHLSPAL